jgi:hypothetical protein
MPAERMETRNVSEPQVTHFADDATLANIARLERENAALREALQRSLSWLSSYPGGGALKCWEQATRTLKARVEQPSLTDEQIRGLLKDAVRRSIPPGGGEFCADCGKAYDDHFPASLGRPTCYNRLISPVFTFRMPTEPHRRSDLK